MDLFAPVPNVRIAQYVAIALVLGAEYRLHEIANDSPEQVHVSRVGVVAVLLLRQSFDVETPLLEIGRDVLALEVELLV